jgi:hypothetical protein
MTLAVSRAVPHFSWRHTGAIDRHMRYVSTCVAARVVGGRETMNKRYPLWRMLFTRIGCPLLTCNMYMSDPRHIHDPVLSSLEMEGIRVRLLFNDYVNSSYDVPSSAQNEQWRINWNVHGSGCGLIWGNGLGPSFFSPLNREARPTWNAKIYQEIYWADCK